VVSGDVTCGVMVWAEENDDAVGEPKFYSAAPGPSIFRGQPRSKIFTQRIFLLL
jgi:hypothetical protein